MFFYFFIQSATFFYMRFPTLRLRRIAGMTFN
jgi:hypothetical protein